MNYQNKIDNDSKNSAMKIINKIKYIYKVFLINKKFNTEINLNN